MDITGKIIVAAYDYRKNIEEFIKIPEEREKLKSEVERILDMLSHLVYTYREELSKNKEKLDEKIEIVNGITRYLVEHHCKPKSPKQESENFSKREENKYPPTITINTSKDKDNSDKTYYVFFTTSIFIDNTLTVIISKPILYDGIREHISTNQKDDFINQINDEIFHKKQDKKEELMKDNYGVIKVNYGKPYSTKLLKTTEEASQAIEAYKQSQEDAVSGVGTIKFFQLN